MDYFTKQVSILEKRTEAVDAVERNQLSAEFCDTMVGFIKFFLYKRFPTFEDHFDDLTQEAWLAVMENLDKYDPEISSPTTFFTCYILDAVCNYINTNITHTTKYYAALETKINQALRQMDEDEEVFSQYTIENLAKKTGLSENQVFKIMKTKQMRREASFDAVLASGAENFIMYPSQFSKDPEEFAELAENNRVIWQCIDFDDSRYPAYQLTATEKIAIKEYYGLTNGIPGNLISVADVLNIDYHKSKSILAGAIFKLRKSYSILTGEPVSEDGLWRHQDIGLKQVKRNRNVMLENRRKRAQEQQM